jgi:hypothetical protein
MQRHERTDVVDGSGRAHMDTAARV